MKEKYKCSYCGSIHRVSRLNGGDRYCLKHYLQMRNHGEINDCKKRKWKNSIEIVNNVTHIVTSAKIKIVIDDEDLEQLKKHSWCISKTGYAVANINGRTTKMHRYLMKAQNGYVVDHINGNPLDNRKCNLRVCTQKQNSQNLGLSKNNTSGYPGVNKKTNGKYRSRITVDRKEICLGTFNTIEEAIKARKEAELKYFGDFARMTKKVEDK